MTVLNLTAIAARDLEQLKVHETNGGEGGTSTLCTVVEVGLKEESPKLSRLCERIVEIVWFPRSFGASRGPDGSWWSGSPGARPKDFVRSEIRQEVTPPEFDEAVTNLIVVGYIMEVWVESSTNSIFLLPGWSHALSENVVRARGRLDVIMQEPWSSKVLKARE